MQGNRKVIAVHNARFTDYHNVLYYIYTGQLNLRYPQNQFIFKDGRPISPQDSMTVATLSGQTFARNGVPATTSQLNVTTMNSPHGTTIVNSQVVTTQVTNVVSYSWDSSAAFPRPAFANEIYRLAGMMGLTELQSRAYHFLMSTTSVDNIFDRLFDPYCKSTTHAPVRSVYQGFLARNWETIRQSGQWAQLLRRYRATQEDEEAEYLLEVLCEILNAVTWDPKLTSFISKAH
jgi:hypothetical protein